MLQSKAVAFCAIGVISVCAWSILLLQCTSMPTLLPWLDNILRNPPVKYNENAFDWTDHASFENGGAIIDKFTSTTYKGIPRSRFFKVPWILGWGRESHTGRQPSVVLRHNGSDATSCWPFRGRQGQLAIQLPYPVQVERVSVYHLPQNISISRSLAPRQVGFWGIVENSPGIQHKPLIADQNEKITIQPTSGEADGLDAILIANFTYDAHSTAVVQGYGSISGARERSMPFTSIVVFVQDNWGDDEATCLCGVHVYGQRVNMEGNSSYI